MKYIPHNFQVGDDVSRGFNGDWYPCGKVARITKKYLFTDNGQKFSLRTFKEEKLEDVLDKFEWVEYTQEYFKEVNGSPFVLAKGIISELNPHF